MRVAAGGLYVNDKCISWGRGKHEAREGTSPSLQRCCSVDGRGKLWWDAEGVAQASDVASSFAYAAE